jgi:uncharacterized protein
MIPGMSLSQSVYAVVLCAGFGQAQAPAARPIDPSKAAVIEQTLALNHSDQIPKQFLDQYRAAFKQAMEQSLVQTLRQQGITDAGPFNPDVQKFENRVFDLLGERFTWERLKPEFVSLYDETFTLEDVQGILAFYKSPPGQVFLGKMPAIVTGSAQIGQAQIREVVPEVQKMTNEFTEDLKKKAAETKK